MLCSWIHGIEVSLSLSTGVRKAGLQNEQYRYRLWQRQLCCCCCYSKRGIDIVPSKDSKYETPAVVSFENKQRFFGAAGVSLAATNAHNTISQIKRMIGRRFSDPELQLDMKRFPFSVIEGDDGFPLIQVTCYGKEHTFSPIEVFAMILVNLKTIAKRYVGETIKNCSIGIPAFFTDIQRRAVLQAAEIAGFNPPPLIHEMTAVALAYGIYKTDLPKNGKLNVAFVDVGHASMQVCIVEYKEGHIKVLGHAYDQSLGGRDFDNALFDHFATKFKQDYGLDVYQNDRACARLMLECEKTKKVLSANPVAHINIDCLMNEKDMKYVIERKSFENISIPILERVKDTLVGALKVVNECDIHEVEVVGSGSRIPAITQILEDFFPNKLRQTLNASECVARGCALHCASLSPSFRVREMKVVQDSAPCWERSSNTPVSIAILRKDVVHEGRGTLEEPMRLISQSDHLATLVFQKPSTISLDLVVYDNGNASETQKLISTYKVGPVTEENDEVHITFARDRNGIFSFHSATTLLVEYDPVMFNTKQMSGVGRNDILKVRKKDLPIGVHQHHYGALSSRDLENFVVFERTMAKEDILMIETKERKNTLESYVYKMREEFNDKYKNVLKAAQADRFDIKLQEIERWLYNEGEDADKNEYIAKLEELKKQGNSMEKHYNRLALEAELDADRRSLMEKIDNHSKKWKFYRTSGVCSMQIDVETDSAMTFRENEVTKDEAKEALQDYVLNMRNELKGKYRAVSAQSEKQNLFYQLQETQKWLNGKTLRAYKEDFVARLKELKRRGDSLEVCYKKDLEAAESKLIDELNVWRNIFSDDKKWNSISPEEQQKVLGACNSAEQLLSMKERQGLLPELVDLKNATQKLNELIGLYKRSKPTWWDYTINNITSLSISNWQQTPPSAAMSRGATSTARNSTTHQTQYGFQGNNTHGNRGFRY